MRFDLRIIGALLVAGLCCAAPLLATEKGFQAPKELVLPLPESGTLIPWQSLQPPGVDSKTNYRIIDVEGREVVHAKTSGSASGLLWKASVDPHEYEIIEWSWKVSNVFASGDATSKTGDDYPARLYIAFAFEPERYSWLEQLRYKAVELFYGEQPPGSALNYIWANRLAKDAFVPNPFTAKTMMIAVSSGADKVNQWQSYRRNIVEDYRQAFGHDPPEIVGIGIMSDSDNTGESAEAWFGQILLRNDQ